MSRPHSGVPAPEPRLTATQSAWGWRAGAALLSLVGSLGLAQAADLHLVQQFEIRQKSLPLLREQREMFLQGSAVILRNPTHHVLIRADLQRAWLLDGDRQVVSEVPTAELRLNPVRKDLGPMPDLQSTTETRKILGFACQVYRTAGTRIMAEACVTRHLPALEKFRDLLGAKPEAPGIPLTFRIQITGHDPSASTTIEQRLLKVETARLDPRLFAPPGEPATAGKPAR